ncbi:ribosome biogenesis GTPase A [Candidatus Photodesmus katoptron]|uniref:Ribosome biogenesis GTPase A n=1 Tax=Candidatus Photodesmus katoptron Akat1 TaxID=1236703 RepID=S3DIS1_9GAMM|nr:ribosome biogenesis GTPase YlqF [Candidatus Photodesmus katoptron]EPE37620.1 ribosomal biogenesis GTPase [Candidatus Photodesmus katoptron Akat1]KEY90661.1 ribosome biogenesis GTPase A [Candidatus Photodesmus katoptron]
MSIQWFPGHMYKATKKIEEIVKQIDIFIEILDARIPFSSQNPIFPKWYTNKHHLTVLNKSDLADPKLTKLWMQYFQKKEIKAISTIASNLQSVCKIKKICRKFIPSNHKIKKNIKVMIIGIPNVGKSTIINTLASRTISVTGNQPAITRSQQCVNLKNGIVLYDTPGIFLTKIEDRSVAFRLAAIGAVKNIAIEYDEVAIDIISYLLKYYPEKIKKRYKIKKLPESSIEIINAIGINRGTLKPGAYIDNYKACEIFLNEFRNGILKEITLESPEILL